MSKTEKIQEFCNKVNILLENNNPKDIVGIIDEMENNIQDADLYWSRSVYITCKCNSLFCWETLLEHPEWFKCVTSDDPDEHPGLTIKFKDNEVEERW